MDVVPCFPPRLLVVMKSCDSTDAPPISLHSLIKTLPACKRCRDCRRGCDTQLPRCRQCIKAGHECKFWDGGRQAWVQRSYISHLVNQICHLDSRITLRSNGIEPPGANSKVPGNGKQVDADISRHFLHHFASAENSYRYLGSQSCLIKAPIITVPENKDTGLSNTTIKNLERKVSVKDTQRTRSDLLNIFLAGINLVYPVVDVKARYALQDSTHDFTVSELFLSYMVFSISCYIAPNLPTTKDGKTWERAGPASIVYRELAQQYFQKAMPYLEATTMEPTIATLRAVLLLAIHSMFDPKEGNFGQQLALAARLAFDLESKKELKELEPDDAEFLRKMHMTIFCLENQVASTLDRPTHFPEPEGELAFAKHKPADYMCSLFRLQYRFRRGDNLAKESVRTHLPMLDENADLLPIVRISLHMTHLLLDPRWETAWHVLEAVVSLGGVHVFITPHWVYRAGTVILQNMSEVNGQDIIPLYSNALMVLELSSWKWPSSKRLSKSLADLMEHMKVQCRPFWNGTLVRGSVTM